MLAGSAAAVETAWGWLRGHSYAEDRLAAEYADWLIGQHQPKRAAEVWVECLGGRKGGYPSENRLFNGSFESEPAGAALDWRTARVGKVAVQRDSSSAFEGDRSPRI